MGKVYETLRFGKIEVREEDFLHFPEGLLGFSECKQFVLLEDQQQVPFKWLQSLDNSDLNFVLVDPVVIKPDYQIQVPREEVASIDLEDAETAKIFVIVTLPRQSRSATANLKGPLVVNPSNRQAKQVVLPEDQYSTQYRFLDELQKQEQIEQSSS